MVSGILVLYWRFWNINLIHKWDPNRYYWVGLEEMAMKEHYTLSRGLEL